MPKQTVYSVHQRSSDSLIERELGVFTDSGLADQAIEHLYRYAWNAAVSGLTSEWLDAPTAAMIVAKGIDQWWVDDKNSLNPMFYKKMHDLWNSVPPAADQFKFTQEIVTGGNVPVVEVDTKRLF